MTSLVDEADQQGSGTSGARSAGRLLREARLARGLSMAALAGMLKVPAAKLEALEADRLQDLPDATFVRALAKAVCGALKIEFDPVLDLLPKGGMPELDRVSRGLNQPFREKSVGADLAVLDWLKRPAAWAVLALILGAAALFLAPAQWLQWPVGTESAEQTASPVLLEPAVTVPVAATPSSPVLSAASSAASSGGGLTTAQTGVPAVGGAAPVDASRPVAPLVASPASVSAADSRLVPLRIRVRDASWVEVVDAQGQVLHSRLMRAGDMAELSGLPPLKLRVGNVAATEVTFRGALLDLAAQSRDNVARIDLP